MVALILYAFLQQLCGCTRRPASSKDHRSYRNRQDPYSRKLFGEQHYPDCILAGSGMLPMLRLVALPFALLRVDATLS